MRRLLPIIIIMAACGDGAVDEADPSGEVGLIEFIATWDQTDVTLLDAGWAITNDLGYSVEVHDGYLVTYGASLVPCPTATHEHDDLGALLWSLIGIGAAHAGHDSDVDPSAISTSRVESVATPKAWTIGRVAVPPAVYCEAHYLVARADDATLDMPQTVDLDRASLYLSGVYTPPGGGEARPFEVKTALANGVIAALDVEPGGAGGVNLGETGLTVVIERPLAGLFDGVDFDNMSSAALEQQLLTALIANTSIRTYSTP